MRLLGIEDVLKDGGTLHAWRVSNGLRAVYLMEGGEAVAYGEHPWIEDALSHANESLFADDGAYSGVYGVTKPRYTTGVPVSLSELDRWFLNGHVLDAWFENGLVVVRLEGMKVGPESLRPFTKTGRGKDFFAAAENALKAAECMTAA